MKLLLIGAGKFGQNYIKTIHDMPEVSLNIATRDTWRQMVDARPDGVMICTPPDSHVEIAERALAQGIPTMIEKPLALSYTEASILKKYQDNIPILVNNIHLFSSAYLLLRDVALNEGVRSITSAGGNSLGIERDYSSLFDYGPHELSMGQYLMGKSPRVECAKKFHGGQYSILKFMYDDIDHVAIIGNGIARKTRIFSVLTCNDRLISYDDCSEGKLTGIDIPKTMNVQVPPLKNAISIFIGAIDGIDDARLGLDISLETVRLLEECESRY